MISYVISPIPNTLTKNLTHFSLPEPLIGESSLQHRRHSTAHCFFRLLTISVALVKSSLCNGQYRTRQTRNSAHLLTVRCFPSFSSSTSSFSSLSVSQRFLHDERLHYKYLFSSSPIFESSTQHCPLLRSQPCLFDSIRTANFAHDLGPQPNKSMTSSNHAAAPQRVPVQRFF